jgi:preprotein translocase subunit YajC
MNLMTLFFLAPAQGGGDASLMWIMMIAIFVIMYFFMIRPQSKKQKEISNFRKTIKVGQKVITAGGIHGEIKEINDNIIVLEIANNIKIKIDKNSVFADSSDVSGSITK